MNGVLNVYKEKGFTSHDVVAKLRGILKQRRIGHTGTLDPEAEGVLPVCLGTATKLCDMLTDKVKVYRAEVVFGVATDTEDMTGTIVKELPVTCTKADLEAVLPEFLGEIKQIPPMYSAIKVGGKKLYELAREGREIERKARDIVIHGICLQDAVLNSDGVLLEATLEVTCGKGTYIRSLCRDIGERLGTCACMKSLVRLQSGDARIEHSLKLSEIEEAVKNGTMEESVVSVESIFASCGTLVMKAEWDRLLHNGNKLSAEVCVATGAEAVIAVIGTAQQTEPVASAGFESGKRTFPDTWLRAYDSKGMFCGVYEYQKKTRDYAPVKMFLEDKA